MAELDLAHYTWRELAAVKFKIEPCENCGTQVCLWGDRWWMERVDSPPDRWLWRDHTPERCQARRGNA